MLPMKGLFYTLVFICSILTADASVVLWDCFVAYNEIVYDGSVDVKGGRIYPSYADTLRTDVGFVTEMGFTYILNEEKTEIKMLNPDISGMPAAGEMFWLRMYAEETLDEAAFSDSTRFFVGIGEEYPSGVAGDSIEVVDGQHLYMGVKTQGRMPDATLRDLYGWVELIVVGDEIAVGDSVLGLEGQSLIVGRDYSAYDIDAVPEPNSSILVVLGLSMLGLRRRPLL